MASRKSNSKEEDSSYWNTPESIMKLSVNIKRGLEKGAKNIQNRIALRATQLDPEYLSRKKHKKTRRLKSQSKPILNLHNVIRKSRKNQQNRTNLRESQLIPRSKQKKN